MFNKSCPILYSKLLNKIGVFSRVGPGLNPDPVRIQNTAVPGSDMKNIELFPENLCRR